MIRQTCASIYCDFTVKCKELVGNCPECSSSVMILDKNQKHVTELKEEDVPKRPAGNSSNLLYWDGHVHAWESDDT